MFDNPETVLLNEAARRKDLAAQEARLASREPQKEAGKEAAPGNGSPTRDDGLQPGERNLASELAAQKARDNAKDVLLIEAVQILGDAARTLQSGAGFAAIVK